MATVPDTVSRTAKEHDEQYRMILEFSPVMLYEFLVTKDMEFHFRYANPACKELLSLSAEELIAYPERFFELMLSTSQGKFFRAVKEAMHNASHFDFEDWLFFPNGTQKHIRWTA